MPTTKPNKYVAKIYGFKIFGRKGSKYEGVPLIVGDEKKSQDESEKDVKMN